MEPITIRKVDVQKSQEYIVGRSRNLRGLLEHSRKHGTYVEHVKIAELPRGRGSLQIFWADKAYAACEFESYTVLEQFVRSRRSWKGAWLHIGHWREDGRFESATTEKL